LPQNRTLPKGNQTAPKNPGGADMRIPGAIDMAEPDIPGKPQVGTMNMW
jgi:hypothetical protein